jgi:predicted PurR-regulated permease PerM
MDAPDVPTPATRPPRLVREVDLDWRSVLVMLVSLVALLAVIGLLRRVPRTLTALGVGTIVAVACNPPVVALQRRFHLPRGVAVTTVLAAITAFLVVIGMLLVPPAVRQARDLGHQLPSVVQDLGKLPVVGKQVRKANVADRIQRSIEQLPDRLAGNTAPLEKAARSVADSLLLVLVTLLVAMALMVDGPRLVHAARRLVPADRREQADHAGRLAYRIVGRYVAGSLLVAVVCGFVILVAGLALHVPLTPLAAVWAALWDLVPQIGGAAGGIPFVILGLTRGTGTAIACAAVFVVYQQLKHQVIQPVLIGQAVKLSPPATMTAALVGVSAGGVVGALLAVPLVGAAKAVYLEFRKPGVRYRSPS